MFPEFKEDDLKEKEIAIYEKIKSNKKRIQELLDNKIYTFASFLGPYQTIQTELSDLSTEISHVNSVKNSEESQTIYANILPKLTEYYTDLAQNEDIFQALLKIESEDTTLNLEQSKVLKNEIRDFRLAGVGLEATKKSRLKEINIRLSDLSNQFSQNVLNATNAFEMILDETEVDGMPESEKRSARTEDGRYKFTLHYPSYISYMTYGPSRERRAELYKASVTKAPENGKILEEILKLRKEEAELLGFASFAQLSLASKVAESPDQVLEFLTKLNVKAKPVALKEYQRLKDFASEQGVSELQAYDLTYFSEMLKKKLYHYEEDKYRPYLEKESVVQGTFQFLSSLLGIQFKQADTRVWHPSVLCYDIIIDKQTRARLYLDLEARKEKKGGAWMHNWKPHFITENNEKILPIAFVVGNFPVAREDVPSLLKPSDVVTLFHELGHALHHLLSQVGEAFVSGVNGVEWDAVEFPSQFLENFAYEPKVLDLFAKHYQTGEKIPREFIETMVEAKNFQSAMAVVRQLEFAIFDMRIHLDAPDEEGVQKVLDEVRKETAVFTTPSYNKFQNSFSHIFAGGYAAGYYSYKWAELLSANAFYKFVDEGIFSESLAEKFRKCILEKGGSESAMKLFRDFYGKDPDIEALLRLNGIAA
ncbi:Zn-dependent oligopeptidase [Leptospira ryugenii]|uniref:oligopeptidase A n=1 Tax=Leptospira ryugenii TaxID=1917863 RepID=A0A2P2E0Q9_9LEPT|nr:M3 family metallopeptidase [Leptospira ryugenii]GBF50477.1 Zn-dependent oligopeptidase [Leptospira ryugenii]